MARHTVLFSICAAIIFINCFCLISSANVPRERSFIGTLFGLNPKCVGCPPRFCDDDPAIIHGYCCGCAKLFDRLPVQCSPYLRCPTNTLELCDQYEYMLYCCCNK